MPNEEIIGGKWTLDITDIKAGLTEANRLIRVVDSEFKAVAAGMGDWGKNADGLSAKISSLNTIVDIQEQKVSALKEQYKKVAEEKGSTSRAAQDLEIKINNETASLNKNKLEIDQAKAALEKLNDTTEETSRKQETLRHKTQELTASMNDLAKKALVGLTTAASLASVAIFKLMNNAGEFADEVVTLSNKTGISVKQLQELDYAAKFVDVSVETMTGSMNKMTRTMDAARDSLLTGKLNEQAQAYRTLGVEVVNVDGSLRNNKDVFYQVIDALGQVKNETERDALAMEIFGKSAIELNPLIKAGSDELNRLAIEANAVGAVVSESAIVALAEFDDNMNTLKSSTQGLLNEALAELMPVINDLVTLIKENMPMIIEWITGFISFAIEQGPTMISIIAGITVGLLSWNVVVMIQGLIAAVKAWTLATEGMSIAQKLLNIVMATNPIGLIITLIAALVGWFITMMATNESFRNNVIKIWNEVWNNIKGVGENIRIFFTKTLPGFFSNIGQSFVDIGNKIVQGVWNGITGLGDWLRNQVYGFFSGIVNGVKKVLGIKSPSRVFAGIGEYMAQGLGIGFTDEMKSVNKDIQGSVPTSLDSSLGIGSIGSQSGSSPGSNLSFTQNIYSPKALSAYEVYRQTKNASQALALGVLK